MKKLIGLLVMVCLFAACEVSDDYSVEGVIKQNGSALANVQVELQREYGAVIATGTTNYRGVYSITTVYGGPYHVVPAKDGYYFTPAYVAVNLDDYTPHVSGVDFTANVLNRVSGHVYQGRTPLEGITVTLDGRESLTTLTDAQGYYEFILDFQGTVTVSVSSDLSGYYFEDPEQTVAVNGDVSGVDFTATDGNILTGKVSVEGYTMAGIRLQVEGLITMSAETNESGIYAFGNLPSGQYTVSVADSLSAQPESVVVTVDGYVSGIDFELLPLVWEGDYNVAEQGGSLNGLIGYTRIAGSLILEEVELEDLSEAIYLVRIDGDLQIRRTTELIQLKGLENLQSVGGDLILYRNHALLSLTPLSRLNTVGGSLEVNYSYEITSLKGIEHITSLGNGLLLSDLDIEGIDYMPDVSEIPGDLKLANLDVIPDYSGLEHIISVGGTLSISGNELTTSLKGFENLTSIGGLFLCCNYSMEHIPELENVRTALSGDLIIKENLHLIDIEGLQNITGVDGSIEIYNNYNFASVSGLRNVQGTVWALVLENMPLSSLDGLQQITGITNQLCLQELDNITDLSGLDHIVHVGSNIRIWNNAKLKNIKALSSIPTFSGNLVIGYNDLITDLEGIEGISGSVTGFSAIGNLSLENIDALVNVTSLDYGIYIDNNASLTSIDGLRNVCQGEYSQGLTIRDNPKLRSLSPLSNFTEFSSMEVVNNASLVSLSGLHNVISVPYYMQIENNASLTSLDSLSGLQAVGTWLRIRGNASLTSVSGLSNVSRIGTDLSITNNSDLCENLAWDLVDEIGEENIGGEIEISGNRDCLLQ